MAELWSLRGLSWRELAKRTCLKSCEDEIFGQSARLAFYFFFAMFPVLLLLLILLGKSAGAGSELRGALLDSFKQVLPPEASALMAKTIQQLNARAVRLHCDRRDLPDEQQKHGQEELGIGRNGLSQDAGEMSTQGVQSKAEPLVGE
jgi:hypothetical protein